MPSLSIQSADLHALGAAANKLNAQKNGSKATYIVNRYINYSIIAS